MLIFVDKSLDFSEFDIELAILVNKYLLFTYLFLLFDRSQLIYQFTISGSQTVAYFL